MKKKILFAFLFFGLCLAIADPVKAGAFKVKCPKKITVKFGGETDRKYKATFIGHNVTFDCETSIKGNKGHIVESDDLGYLTVNATKTKRKHLTVRIKFYFSPYWGDSAEEDYDNENYVYSETFGHIKKSEYEKDYVVTKKIKIKIKSNKKLTISSELYDYVTRDNYFQVKIKNKSYKTITVLSTGAKAIDKDYKSYDRNLRTGRYRNIKIKPGKTKYVNLYVIGSNTWPDTDDFTIKVRIKYRGKIYKRNIY